MKQHSIILLLCITILGCQSKYIVGDQGLSCYEACFNIGMNCNPKIVTNDNLSLFIASGIICKPDTGRWGAEDQPGFISGSPDPNTGKCLGYVGLPSATQCSGKFWATRRLCNCDAPSTSHKTFGTGISNGAITTDERWVFSQILKSGDVGVLTHFWTTYGTVVDRGVVIRYYIDGEKNASIQFTPSLASGVGYYDAQGPWGTEWIGKGAADGGWYNNFKIPFQKSLVVTVQHLYANYSGFYLIVRGATNVPITVGGVTLPKNARMNQYVVNTTFQPLDWVPLVNITSGPGVHWMVTVSGESATWNFIEGCFHAYLDNDFEFPGVVLGTGTEDYFDSGWTFNAGQFHLPVSGFTHMSQNSSLITWSAYRFHDKDAMFFDNGFQLVWRNGDMLDAAGMKCSVISGGTVVGNPAASKILAYGWTYTWPAQGEEGIVV